MSELGKNSPVVLHASPVSYSHIEDAGLKMSFFEWQALDNFKRSDQSGEWAFQVLGQPGRPLETRMFATKVLITLCNVKWKGWSGTVQEQFRTAVMSLLELPSGREHPIVEAMGKVLGEVAEKQYPQQWPKMLEDMALAWESRGPAAATIGTQAMSTQSSQDHAMCSARR